MENRQAIFECIHSDFPADDRMSRACTDVVEYLLSTPTENLRFITFGALSRAAKMDTAHEVLPVAQYLSGARIHLLDTCYLLVEDDEEYDVCSEDVLEAKRTGILYHPDLGEPVSDFEEKLIVYFALSSTGKKMSEARN